MTLGLLWTLLRKLPWKIIAPLAVILALGLCVRAQLKSNARADAYASVARLTATYAQQQEQKRMVDRKQAEDSIKAMRVKIDTYAEHAALSAKKGRELAAKLRANPSVPRPQLDSLEYNYQEALAWQDARVLKLEQTITLRTQERDQAEQQLALTKVNLGIQTELAQREAKRSGSTLWKIATGLSVVAGVVAYATKH